VWADGDASPATVPIDSIQETERSRHRDGSVAT